MTIDIKIITEYIDYLKKTGLFITLHGDIINGSVLTEYNYHQNPYCHYVKSVYKKLDNCICTQKKVLNKCADGSFFGCCYAGVGEFVYPVNKDDQTIGFISVSGYYGENTESKTKHFANKHGIKENECISLSQKYLKKELPKKRDIDALINPLCYMVSSYASGLPQSEDPDRVLYRKIVHFITENCHSKITMETLSHEFSYSISKISHLFAKHSGKSLPEYIDTLRINEAKWYIKNTDASISEISEFLGYCSSNYFSEVFKRKCGITPKKYRTSNTKKHL